MTTDPSSSGDRPEDHLRITRSEAPDAATVTLALDGDLDPFTAPLLTAELDDTLQGGVHTLELDVSRLRFLDSSGLRVLIVAHNQLDPKGGGVVLVGPSDATRRVIEISGLDQSFTLRP